MPCSKDLQLLQIGLEASDLLVQRVHLGRGRLYWGNMCIMVGIKAVIRVGIALQHLLLGLGLWLELRVRVRKIQFDQNESARSAGEGGERGEKASDAGPLRRG